MIMNGMGNPAPGLQNKGDEENKITIAPITLGVDKAFYFVFIGY